MKAILLAAFMAMILVATISVADTATGFPVAILGFLLLPVMGKWVMPLLVAGIPVAIFLTILVEQYGKGVLVLFGLAGVVYFFSQVTL